MTYLSHKRPNKRLDGDFRGDLGIRHGSYADGCYARPESLWVVSCDKTTASIEQMGTQAGNYRKEFWWEREWRYQGNLYLPRQVLILCPEAEIGRYRRLVQERSVRMPMFMDPSWGLEEIIGRLAGFLPDEIEVF